jgi:RNA polymerase sigma factor (sigma-70 family)
VTGLCRALLRDGTEAEDATQQVFLSAHRALLNGSTPREPAAWLAAIARNECRARIKGRMREPLPSADVEVRSWLPDPLAEAIRKADLAALWSAMEALPAQQRHALLLREFGGLSYEELGAALAVSTPAVESLLFRARQGLRTRLRILYAALSGVSWLESLPRFLAGGSGVAAPVAAKVAVLGIGAAAVTGGALVGPAVLEPHHHAIVPARGVAHPEPRHTAVVFVPRPVRPPELAASHDGDSAAERSGTTFGERDGDRAPTTTTSSSTDGHDSQPIAVQRPDGDTSTPPTPVASVTGDGGGDGMSGGGASPSGTNGGE